VGWLQVCVCVCVCVCVHARACVYCVHACLKQAIDNVDVCFHDLSTRRVEMRCIHQIQIGQKLRGRTYPSLPRYHAPTLHEIFWTMLCYVHEAI